MFDSAGVYSDGGAEEAEAIKCAPESSYTKATFRSGADEMAWVPRGIKPCESSLQQTRHLDRHPDPATRSITPINQGDTVKIIAVEGSMFFRVATIGAAPQELMTRDNVPVSVGAVVYFRWPTWRRRSSA